VSFKRCPICRSNSTKLSYSAQHKKIINANNQLKASGSEAGGRNIYRCMECEVFFCHPLPSQDELMLEYDSSDDEAFVSQNEFRYKTFDYHFNLLIGELNLDIGNIFVTDIGAASGVFLKVANTLGAQGRGFEANKWLVNYGRNNYKVDLIQGSIREFIPSENKVDIVSFWDVIEHLSEPYEELFFLSSQLKPKSIVIISLPSTDSKSFKLLKWYWPMHLNVHLFYFNKKSLNYLLSSCGFKMIHTAKYEQTLSLGYLIYRGIKIFFPNIKDTSVKFLTDRFLNRISIKYSIGQRIYVFEKI
jgi:2-polyprenyl-3-methyl-5-hydroxy-6-metoxy-1,4-benzoquinol methylase